MTSGYDTAPGLTDTMHLRPGEERREEMCMTMLSEMLETQRGSEKVHVTPDDQALVGFRLDGGRHAGWRMGFRLQRPGAHSSWRVVEVTLLTPDGVQDFGAASIRHLPLGHYLAKARGAATAAAPPSRPRLAQPSDVDLLSAFARRGPKRDLDYALLALRYTELVRAGDRRPAETIAGEAGHGSAAVWTNRLAEARNKRGLLTPVKRGETGGELTPRALSLLGIE
jgi:hypothetical protein